MRTTWRAAALAAVVLAGQALASGPAWSAEGGLDRGFANQGYLTTRLGAATSPGVSLDAVVRQADGKLVVGGSVDDHPVAARFLADGTPDSSFGSGGVARLTSVSGFSGAAVALDAGGRVLVAGGKGSPLTAVVVAFTPAGSPDPSFGTGGVAGMAGLVPFAMAVQPDGKVVVAGQAGTSTSQGALARFTATGGPDPTFDGDGLLLSPRMSYFSAVVLDGTKVVAAGANADRAALERYSATGTPDATFSSDGHADTTGVLPSAAEGLARTTAGDYLVLVSGDFGAVARVDTNGDMDLSFGPIGTGVAPLTGMDPWGLLLEADGHILALGDSSPRTISGRTEAVAERLDTDGLVDAGFGCGGQSFFNWGPEFNAATSAVALPGGGYVAAGWRAGFEGDHKELVLAKLHGPDATAEGYRLLGEFGDVQAFGHAAPCATGTTINFSSPPVGMDSLPGGQGSWTVAADGGVFAFGAAQFHGSMGGTPLNSPVVGMAAAPDGNGYWLVAADGGIFAFDSAGFHNSMGGTPLNSPVVGMAATPDGNGYWLVAADGGVFAFGSAGFYHSMGGTPLNSPVVGMAAAPDGRGYWLAAADGGVFAFGSAAFQGSMGGTPLAWPVVGMAASSGGGYWLAGSDGGVFAFGASAPFLGSAARGEPRPHYVGIAAG
jgi:uncharacterized delta-60 repeat protein